MQRMGCGLPVVMRNAMPALPFEMQKRPIARPELPIVTHSAMPALPVRVQLSPRGRTPWKCTKGPKRVRWLVDPC